MRRYFGCLFLVSCLVLASKSHSGDASSEPSLRQKILLIVHSYAMDYEWTAEEDEGIVKAFNERGLGDQEWQIQRIFLNTKKNGRPDQIQQAVMQAKQRIATLHPDAAILTDDDAAKGLLTYLKEENIPTSVAGINGNIEDYGYVPGERDITGSLERHNIPPVIKIVKHLRPSIENVLLVSETSVTGQAMLKNFREQLEGDPSLKELGIKRYDEFVDTSFKRLKNHLVKVDPHKTVVVFVAFFTFHDENNNHTPYKKIDEWVNKNTQFLDIGCAIFNVRGGRLISLAASPMEMGYYSAAVLFDMIFGNEKHPVRQQIPLQLVINKDRAKNLDIEIPFDLLAYAGTSNILFHDQKMRDDVK